MTAAVTRAARVITERTGFRFDAGTRRRLETCLADRSLATGYGVDTLVDDLTRGVGVDDLVDALTVQESAFFRHPEQFAALRDELVTAPGPITVWSAGCANGQEPYSIAMLLAELGREDWRVVATDISRPALARTAAGVYHERELTGLDAARRARHGSDGPDGWTVDASLRDRVDVVRHRLMIDGLPVPEASCQVVLCRNVLIYLEPQEAERFLTRAGTALTPGGHLLLGGSEALVHRPEGLQPGRFGPAFAYRSAPPVATIVATTAPAPPAELPSVAALLHMGEAASAVGDHERAVRTFRQAVYLNPDHGLARVRLAFALEAIGDHSAARSAFRVAIELVEDVTAADLDGHDPATLVELLESKLQQEAVT